MITPLLVPQVPSLPGQTQTLIPLKRQGTHSHMWDFVAHWFPCIPYHSSLQWACILLVHMYILTVYYYFSKYIYVCCVLCLHMCLEDMHVCSCMWRPEVDCRCLLHLHYGWSSPTQLDWLVSELQRYTCLPPRKLVILRAQLLMWVLMIRPEIFMIARQVPYWVSPHPSLPCGYFQHKIWHKNILFTHIDLISSNHYVC